MKQSLEEEMNVTNTAKKTCLAVTAAAGLMLGSIAQAEVVTVVYTGQVTTVFGPPVFSDIPAPFDSVSVGDPITVEYTLDTDTMDFTPLAPDIGTFSGAFENFNYNVTIGTATADTLFGGVNTVDADNLPNQDDTYAAIGIYEDFVATVSLMDSTDSAVSANDTLNDINLADFDSAQFILLVGQSLGIQGTLSAIVPEPSTLSLMAIGLLAATRVTRKRTVTRK